jgi:hypothetical protein
VTEHTRDREWLIAAFREVAEMDQRTDERKRGQNYEDAADAVIERLRGDGERIEGWAEPDVWMHERGLPSWEFYSDEAGVTEEGKKVCVRATLLLHPVAQDEEEAE